MKKQLPIYDIVLTDDEQGVSFISLVDTPAIGVNWITLADQQPIKIEFKADKEKQMLYGPFLIPNMLIYRRDERNGEYYVRFSKDEIEKIATKFNKDLNNKNINFMHTEAQVEAFVAENWMIDSDKDKSQSFGFDLPQGTWFGGVKVIDSNFWEEKVKNDEVKGFSVEILADLQLALQKNKNIDMQTEIKLANVMKTDGTPLYYEGTEFVVGTAVFMDEAMTEPAPDGPHSLEGGIEITIADGIVAAIMEIEESLQEEVAAPASISMDQVNEMINVRFTELNEELTNLKKMIDEMKSATENYTSQLKSIKETLSATPAAASITSKEVKKSKVANEFEMALNRVQEFAKRK